MNQAHQEIVDNYDSLDIPDELKQTVRATLEAVEEGQDEFPDTTNQQLTNINVTINALDAVILLSALEAFTGIIGETPENFAAGLRVNHAVATGVLAHLRASREWVDGSVDITG